MRNQKDKSGGIVYSTEHGRMCADCSRPIAECVCGQDESIFKGDGIVRVGRERKGRKGKSVTIITGVALDRQQLVELGKELKKKCGTGGTVKDGVIEVQGDHLSLLVEELSKRGWTGAQIIVGGGPHKPPAMSRIRTKNGEIRLKGAAF